MRKEIESLLRSHGLSPSYNGFFYLADVLELVAGGCLICPNTITLVAKARGVSHSRVYQAIHRLLRRIDLSPAATSFKGAGLYEKIYWLHACLRGEG